MKSQKKKEKSLSEKYSAKELASKIFNDLQKSQEETKGMKPNELDNYFVQKYGIPLETNWD